MTVQNDQLGLELFEDEFIQNPYPLYERMHASGPVHSIGDSGFHAVCAWDAINDAVARPEDFSSNLTSVMTYQDGKVGSFVAGELGGEIQALTGKHPRVSGTPKVPGGACGAGCVCCGCGV